MERINVCANHDSGLFRLKFLVKRAHLSRNHEISQNREKDPIPPIGLRASQFYRNYPGQFEEHECGGCTPQEFRVFYCFHGSLCRAETGLRSGEWLKGFSDR